LKIECNTESDGGPPIKRINLVCCKNTERNEDEAREWRVAIIDSD